jgi:hypothetical protein
VAGAVGGAFVLVLLIAAVILRRQNAKTVSAAPRKTNTGNIDANPFYAAASETTTDGVMEMNAMYAGPAQTGIYQYAVPHETADGTFGDRAPATLFVRSRNPLYEGSAATDSVVDGPATLFPAMARNPMYASDGGQGAALFLHRNPLYKAGDQSRGLYDK